MVLLCQENNINFKNNHMLKCLEKKKNAFNIFVIPQQNTLNEVEIDNNYKNVKIDNLSDLEIKEIDMIFNSNK